MKDTVVARLQVLWNRARAPGRLVLVAALPAGVIGAVLSLSSATGPRYFERAPPEPSPWVLGEATAARPGTCQIAARVLEDGHGIADAPLRLARVTAEGSVEVWTSRTAASGAHRFIDLPQGTYHLSALVDGHPPAGAPELRCTGAAERAFVDLPLSSAVAEGAVLLEVALSSAGGRALPGAELAIAQDLDGRSAIAGVARVPAGADGRIAVKLAPGSYTVLAQAPNHEAARRTITLRADEPSNHARIALAPAPRIRGAVVDENGAPIGGALVSLGAAFDPTARVARVHTEADGSFSLPIRRGQDVTVSARGGGKVARAAFGVLTSPFGLDGVTLVARAGRNVEGMVSKPDGAPWAFGLVRYRVRDLGLTGVEQADGAGRFVLDGMPADADVEVWAEGNATGAWGAQVSTPAGERLALVYVPAAY
ncbi:MAG: carboxypeptidase regulatory-like domain-containing protein [Deltaproteobacteria bacterium]|nr:carboxypeptidase regulatory-like domain-containing protein [Deltaproteobacteria bacterium]